MSRMPVSTPDCSRYDMFRITIESKAAVFCLPTSLQVVFNNVASSRHPDSRHQHCLVHSKQVTSWIELGQFLNRDLPVLLKLAIVSREQLKVLLYIWKWTLWENISTASHPLLRQASTGRSDLHTLYHNGRLCTRCTR